MALVVVHPGLSTTVQDGGRPGSRHWGVPLGGAADQGSLRLANGLLGNPADAAALELTLLGGAYRAEVDLALALAGAPLVAWVAGLDGSTRAWPVPQAGTLRAGETLHLGGSAQGARCYLAVRGGWQTPLVLGSRSTETPLRIGDCLPAAPSTTPTRRPRPDLVAEFSALATNPTRLRVVVEADWPAGWAAADAHQASYQVGDQSNRVGVRLAGAAIVVPTDPDRLSEPVVPGTIQVAGGQPIILGRAGGTIGGYPNVGHVISADLDRLGQLRPGDRVEWAAVTVAEAQRILAAQGHQSRVALACLGAGLG